MKEYERAVIFRLGRLKGKNGKNASGPGLFFINPFIDNYRYLIDDVHKINELLAMFTEIDF